MEIGAVVAGKYRVDRILGQGGMGLVVQATHLQLGQPVAVKFLLPEVLGKAEVVQRFLREAQAAVRLKSEHVARVIDVGSLENGAPYMVLEYLEGTDLSQLPRAELTTGVIVDLILQACEALFEAHAIGIVHRDIKPANFFVTRRPDGAPWLKLLDFGISKTQAGVDSNLTATQAVMGTPAYMSPEQMRSTRDVDARSDLWSLGIVMYELFEGIPPFQAETFTAFAIKVATEPLPPMRQQLPPGLAEVVYRCLDKDRERRYRGVAELIRALAPYARSATQAAISIERTGGHGAATHSAPTIAAVAAPSTLTAASGAVVSEGARKRRWPLFAALGVVVAAGLGITAVVASRGGHGESATPSALHEIDHGAATPREVTPAVPAQATPRAAPPALAPDAAPPPDAAAPVAPTPVAAKLPAAPGAVTPPSERAKPHGHPIARPSRAKPAGSAAAAGDDDILGDRH